MVESWNHHGLVDCLAGDPLVSVAFRGGRAISARTEVCLYFLADQSAVVLFWRLPRVLLCVRPVLDFLFSFNKAMGIAPEMRINDWLSFVMFLPLGFGIAFQLPLVMLFVNRIGLVSVEAYWDKWRIAVMGISVLSMLLTPADPISMVLMAGPLTVLYFLGIYLCKWMPTPTRDNPFGEGATT